MTLSESASIGERTEVDIRPWSRYEAVGERDRSEAEREIKPPPESVKGQSESA